MLPKAFEIDNAAKDVATRFWKDHNFNRGIALHRFLDGWNLKDEERKFVRDMLRNDVLYYLKNAPESLDLPNPLDRFIMPFVNAFDNVLETVANIGYWLSIF